MENRILIECSDVTEFVCDVLVLKYAQAVFGADAQVATLLTHARNAPEISPLPVNPTCDTARGRPSSRAPNVCNSEAPDGR